MGQSKLKKKQTSTQRFSVFKCFIYLFTFVLCQRPHNRTTLKFEFVPSHGGQLESSAMQELAKRQSGAKGFATSILFYFTISKIYFINYTILFYNTTNISTFIFLCTVIVALVHLCSKCVKLTIFCILQNYARFDVVALKDTN